MLAAAVLAVAAAAVGVAALLSAFDGDDEAEAHATAQRYAAALTAGSSQALAAVACAPPSPRQAAAFDERAGSGTIRWSVLHGPRVEDDMAHGTLRLVDGEQHRDYPFSLLRRNGSWCAHYNWSSLDTSG